MAEYYGEGSVAVSPSQVPVGEQIHPNNVNPDYRTLRWTYTVGTHGLPANKGAGIHISGYTRNTNENRQQTLFSLFDAAKVAFSTTVESPPGTPYTTGFTVDSDDSKHINVILTTRALNEGDLIKVEVSSTADAGSEEGFFVSGCSTTHWMKEALKWEVKSRTADAANGGWPWPDVPLKVQQETGICPGAGTATTIRVDSNASSVDGFYNGWVVWLTNGAGIGQKRAVTAYNGGSREATVAAWDAGQVPDATTTYDLKGWAETKIIARDPAKIRVSVRGPRQGSDILWLAAEGKSETFDVLVSVLDDWGNIDEDFSGTVTLAAKKSDGSSCGSSGISQVVFDGTEGGYKEIARVWLTELPSNGFAWIQATATGLSQVEARPILVWESEPPYHEVFGDYHCHSRTDHSNAYGEPQAVLRYQQFACLLDWQSLGDHSIGASSADLAAVWDAEYVTEQAKHPGLSSQEASCQEGDDSFDDGTYAHSLFYENRSGDFVQGSIVQGWGRIYYTNRNAYAFQAGETATGGTSAATAIVKAVHGSTVGHLVIDQTTVSGFSGGEIITGATSGASATLAGAAGFQQAARAIVAWAEDNRDGSGNRLTRGQLTLIDLQGHFYTGDTITEKRTGGATARVAELVWDTQYADPPFAVNDVITGVTTGASGTVRWIGPKKRLRLETVSGYFLPATSVEGETLEIGGGADKAVYQQGDDNGTGSGGAYKHVCILQANDHAVNINPGDSRSDGEMTADINHRLCRDIVLAKGRNAIGCKHLHGRLLHNWLEGGRLWVDNAFFPLVEAMSDVAQFMGPQFSILNDGQPDPGDDWGLFCYGCYWAWRHGFRVGFGGGSDNHNGHAGSLWWRGHMLDVHAKRVGGAEVAGIPDWPDEAGITGVLLPWDATAYSDGDMMEAMRARRTVAMSGHKSKLYAKLTLGGTDYAPGSIITGSGAKSPAFTVELMTGLPELNIDLVKVVRYQLKPSANLGYEATDLLSASPAARAYVNTTLTDTITLGTGDNTLWVYYVWFRLAKWDPEDEDEPQHWGVASPWYLEYAA